MKRLDKKVKFLARGTSDSIESILEKFKVDESDTTKEIRDRLNALRNAAKNPPVDLAAGLAAALPSVEKKGREAGEKYKQGVSKELQRFDAAAFGSAEFFTRLQEYTTRMGEEQKGTFDVKQKAVVEVKKAPDAAEAKQVKTLEQIRDALQEVIRKGGGFGFFGGAGL
jgi:hypothetical protein